MLHLYLKNVEKNNKAVPLRSVLTSFLKLFNTKKYLGLALKKNCPLTFLCISN